MASGISLNQLESLHTTASCTDVSDGSSCILENSTNIDGCVTNAQDSIDDSIDALGSFFLENVKDRKSDDGDDLPFCFETDHIALKGNTDYQHLLRAVIMLESQRTTAIKDYDRLLSLQEQALADPIQFVENLQLKVDMGIPPPQEVAELPYIPWTEYTSNMDAVLSSYSSKHSTRLKQKKDLLNSIKDGVFFVLLSLLH